METQVNGSDNENDNCNYSYNNRLQRVSNENEESTNDQSLDTDLEETDEGDSGEEEANDNEMKDTDDLDEEIDQVFANPHQIPGKNKRLIKCNLTWTYLVTFKCE